MRNVGMCEWNCLFVPHINNRSQKTSSSSDAAGERRLPSSSSPSAINTDVVAAAPPAAAHIASQVDEAPTAPATSTSATTATITGSHDDNDDFMNAVVDSVRAENEPWDRGVRQLQRLLPTLTELEAQELTFLLCPVYGGCPHRSSRNCHLRRQRGLLHYLFDSRGACFHWQRHCNGMRGVSRRRCLHDAASRCNHGDEAAVIASGLPASNISTAVKRV